MRIVKVYHVGLWRINWIQSTYLAVEFLTAKKKEEI